MIAPPEGAPILTADAMSAAEAAASAHGVSQEELMERAGRAVANAVRRLAAGRSIVALAGPGNNGGDACVAARLLREWGHDVTLRAAGAPRGDAAARMAAAWGGPVAAADAPLPAGGYVLIDGLFGTGLTRALDLSGTVRALFAGAGVRLAIDLPSGLATDSGADLGLAAPATATVALGALKPAHLLARAACGHLLYDPVGLSVAGNWRTVARPRDLTPATDAHKYRRKVTIVAGAMPGAARLAARGAAGAGAGYVVLLGDAGRAGPIDAVVHRPGDALVDALREDDGVMLVGPGLGRDAPARHVLDAAIASPAELILDGDALSLLGGDAAARLAGRGRVTLTPHEGEFERMFGRGTGGKIARTLAAARAAAATIVHKGATTVIANPDGAVRVSADGSHWLASAGTGDVLAGAIAAQGAEAGVWLHARASWLAGAAFSADALADHLPRAVAQCH